MLVDGKGMIYGATESGGTGTCDGGCGIVFKLNPSTGTLTTLVDFQGGANGSAVARAPAVWRADLRHDQFWGYIPFAGASGYGTVFTVNPKTKAFASLHAFNQPGMNDGLGPIAALVPGPDGRLYGVASSAGPNGSGTVFAIDP